jgi:HPt (histidine-containing phosphotransfer) domain-containing protein
MTAESRLDPTIITELIDLGPETGRELVKDLVDLFRAEAPARLTTMRESLAAQDHDGIARAAHAMRGGAGNLGAVGVAQLSIQIEQAAIGGDLLAVSPLLDQLAGELDFVQQALTERLAAMDHG